MAIRRCILPITDFRCIAYNSRPGIQILTRKIHTSEKTEIKFFQNPIREGFIQNAIKKYLTILLSIITNTTSPYGLKALKVINPLKSIFLMNTSLRTLQINNKMKEIKDWDHNFSKSDFMERAKNAAVTISSMLQQSNWKELRGLLTRDGVKKIEGYFFLSTCQHSLNYGKVWKKKIISRHPSARKEFKRLQTEVSLVLCYIFESGNA